jgi:hypothetical protein
LQVVSQGVNAMKLAVDWAKPALLKSAKKDGLMYKVDLDKLPNAAGIYIFGRRWGSGEFEALYVGKADRIRGRVRSHFNNLRLMNHIRDAKNGKRILLAGTLVTKPGQQMTKCLRLVERALIRHFMSEGHDLVNKQGTRIRRHEISSSGKHPKRFFPRAMFLDRTKGE